MTSITNETSLMDKRTPQMEELFELTTSMKKLREFNTEIFDSDLSALYNARSIYYNCITCKYKYSDIQYWYPVEIYFNALSAYDKYTADENTSYVDTYTKLIEYARKSVNYNGAEDIDQCIWNGITLQAIIKMLYKLDNIVLTRYDKYIKISDKKYVHALLAEKSRISYTISMRSIVEQIYTS